MIKILKKSVETMADCDLFENSSDHHDMAI